VTDSATRSAAHPGDFDDLIAANAAYAESFDEGDFDGVAHAGVAIVTCMDSRIDPLRMLGLGHGDAKISVSIHI
jgi:carbonic anhydrase